MSSDLHLKDLPVIDFFKGRKLAIVTMHGKEQVIAPVLERSLQVECFVPEQINTDLLGTFTREVKRVDDVLETLRKKCDLILMKGDVDIAVASEGSFGQHPFYFFAQGNEEMVMFKDKKNGLEVIGKHLTTETNLKNAELNDLDELADYLAEIGFPGHGVILRKSEDEYEHVYKNLTSESEILEVFRALHGEFGKVFAETDMRAHRNPTRMKSIQAATFELVKNLGAQCPSCGTPGFTVVEIKPGLLCESCGRPTKSTLAHIRKCQNCGFEETQYFPHEKERESAQFCDYCNP